MQPSLLALVTRLNKIGLPLFAIVMISFSAFAIDTTDTTGRVQTSLTMMLASVNFQYVLNDVTPNVSYLTLADNFLRAATAMIVVVTGWSCLASVLHRHFDDDFVQTMDRIVGITLVSLWSLFLVPLVHPSVREIIYPRWAPMIAQQKNCLVSYSYTTQEMGASTLAKIQNVVAALRSKKHAADERSHKLDQDEMAKEDGRNVRNPIGRE
eukprot:COSAG01_NODE_3768_length_5718_cov_1.755473_4_plen_210_part_00